MTDAAFFVDHRPTMKTLVKREFHTALVMVMLLLVGAILLRGLLPSFGVDATSEMAETYIGPSAWFFYGVGLFILWVAAALVVEHSGLGVPRRWGSIHGGLHWAHEASPLVGLLATFVSFLIALLSYSEAGPGPETQAAFIEQFAIAFGSSICGGVMALVAFTLQKILPGAS